MIMSVSLSNHCDVNFTIKKKTKIILQKPKIVLVLQLPMLYLNNYVIFIIFNVRPMF